MSDTLPPEDTAAQSPGPRIFRVMTAAIAHAWTDGDRETTDLLLVGKLAMHRFYDRQQTGGR